MAEVTLTCERIAAARRLGSGWIDRRATPVYRLLATMILLIALLAAAFGFAIDRHDLPIMAATLAFLAATGIAFRSRGARRIGSMIEGMALILASTMAACCLSVLLAAAAPPYSDALLERIDALLSPGFSWLDMFRILREHATLVAAMSIVYSSLFWQPFALVALLCLSGREERAWHFIYAWYLTLVICLAVFAVMPAVGTYSFYHLVPADIPAMRLRIGWDQEALLEAVRSGRLRALTPASMTGIIAFPSFHAASGVLLAWGFRRLPVLGALFIVWNVAMICTAPLIGSHYFIDIAAGIAAATVAIAIVTGRLAMRPSIVRDRDRGSRALAT